MNRISLRILQLERRRGLVVTETIGSTRGRWNGIRSDGGTVRPRWRITNPSKYVVVRVSVDSSGAVKCYQESDESGHNGEK